MTVNLPSREELVEACSELANDAGRKIMGIYGAEFIVWGKDDNSPVTNADKAAEATIIAGLRKLTPEAAIVAEEEVSAGRAPRLNGSPFWLVDPLDGTREFVKRNGEFTVNIALIENGRPTVGVVYAPALDVLWRGGMGLGAEKREGNAQYVSIQTRHPPPRGLTVCASRSHTLQSTFDRWLRDNEVTVVERIEAGSSLKFCLVAEGRADIYPRLGVTCEWDTAAGQCILEAAGGEVLTLDGQALLYGHSPFRNPHFVARGAARRQLHAI